MHNNNINVMDGKIILFYSSQTVQGQFRVAMATMILYLKRCGEVVHRDELDELDSAIELGLAKRTP